MADEELAPQGADEGAQAEDGALQTEEQQADPYAELAAEMGWKPKDDWQGDPEAWKPAKDFILAGREIQQSTSRELRSMREQMERISGVTSQIVTDKLAERDAFWQSKFDEAVEAGDTEAARKIAKQMNGAPAQTGPDPQVATWIAKNEWYSKDPLAAARANEISDRLAHLPVPEQLAQAERAIRKEFPEHFPKAKDPPQTNGTGPRHSNPGNRTKGFADMPPESRDIALDLERRLGVPKEATAKSYWADQAKGSVRA